MREIKFRAWDKELEEMLSDVSLQNDTWDMMNEFFRYENDSLFLQYTGLKDKNGVEIYEGDIISYTILRFNGVGYETKEEYGVVEYGDAVFEIDGIPLYVAHAEDDEIETIGNIYENTELLEEVQE